MIPRRNTKSSETPSPTGAEDRRRKSKHAGAASESRLHDAPPLPRAPAYSVVVAGYRSAFGGSF